MATVRSARSGRLEENTVDRVPVDSSNIALVGYDATRTVLEVTFHGGSVYEYYDVPSHVHRELLSAPSKGKYFHQFIREASYRYKRIA